MRAAARTPRTLPPMPVCPGCRAPIDAAARFCASCGAPLAAGAGDTLTGVTADVPTPRAQRTAPVQPPPTAAAPPLSRTAASFERFSPGQVVAERFRIVGLLGRGGMGEVYRADDLTLSQTVALKFLPPVIAADPQRVQRLLDEVRLTRQISHPGVCRVYDAHILPSTDAASPPTVFLAMEYIDGEDLSSLLRRIGRLPHDKAVEIARQLCAGLAAAHDLGVVHRDIKPSNIMLDGRGRARLTDFGIAGDADRLAAAGETGAGTPAYMAPEQLNAQPATVRSDIYALGLVLYEVFTGRAAFKASSLAELRGLHATTDAAPPSTVVPDVDPLVERVILRCLEKDPANRPATPLSVSAALPGGDPLAAALAAGETPSPEMVAAASSHSAVPPLKTLWCVLGFAAALLVLVFLKDSTTLLRRVPFENSTEVLVAKARALLKEVGVKPDAADWACGWLPSWTLLNDIDRNLTNKDRWESLRQTRRPTLQLWYRQAPYPMTPTAAPGTRVRLEDPAFVGEGSARVVLDSAGNLWRFDNIPSLDKRPTDPHAPAPAPARPVDWTPFFRAADLDQGAFKPTDPFTAPLIGCDARFSWNGELPGEGAFSPVPIRIDAAALEGRPVYFRIIPPWSLAAQNNQSASGFSVGSLVDALTFVFAISVGPVLAWRNVRSGRGDRRGAFRLALFVFITNWLGMILPASKLANVFSLRNIKDPAANALWTAVFCWLLYMALEPIIRRVRPWSVVGWSRFIGGRFSDPQVGREAMVGVLMSCVLVAVSVGFRHIPDWIGRPPAMPEMPSLDWFGAPRNVGAVIMTALGQAMFVPIFATFIHTGLRWITRNERAAYALLWLTATALISQDFGGGYQSWAMSAILSAVSIYTLVRYGLLAMGAMLLCNSLLRSAPVTTEISSWFAPIWIVPYALVVSLMLWAAYAAMGGAAGLQSLRLHAASRAA